MFQQLFSKDFSLNKEPIEMSVVPSTIPQVSMVSKDLNLITFGKIQNDGLGKHALGAT